MIKSLIWFKNLKLVLFVLLTMLCSCNRTKEVYQSDINNGAQKENFTLLSSVWKFSMKLNNSKVNPDAILEDFFTGKKSKIKQILLKKRVVVLQYSELNCNICVDSALNDIKVFSKRLKNKNDLVIIAATDNRRYMADFLHVNNLKLSNIFMIDVENNNKLYTNHANMPFVYTIDSDLNISDAFIPYKEMPEIRKEYYEEVYQKYFR